MTFFWHVEDIVLSSKRSVGSLSLLNELVYFLELAESALAQYYYWAF